MSAAAIVRDVLTWARTGCRGAPPFAHPASLGHPPRLDDLLSPPRDLAEQACSLAALHAAKLHCSTPPFGKADPPGAAGIVLAGVVAFAQTPSLALALAEVCPPLSGAWDLVLRDAVASPALRTKLGEAAEGALRACSPLTSLLDKPSSGGEDRAFGLLNRIRLHPDGRRMVVHAFSQPGASTEVRGFRALMMDRLRTVDDEARALVLEVYEAALLHHRKGTLADVALAGRGLLSNDGAVIDNALSLARFWGPLSALRKSHGALLRERPYLDIHAILEGTHLVALAQSLDRAVGGAS